MCEECTSDRRQRQPGGSSAGLHVLRCSGWKVDRSQTSSRGSVRAPSRFAFFVILRTSAFQTPLVPSATTELVSELECCACLPLSAPICGSRKRQRHFEMVFWAAPPPKIPLRIPPGGQIESRFGRQTGCPDDAGNLVTSFETATTADLCFGTLQHGYGDLVVVGDKLLHIQAGNPPILYHNSTIDHR